jgi:hypothetical protein
MELLDIWDSHFRSIVESIAHENNGKKSAAYQEIADRTKYKYDYIYQVYTRKLNKRVNVDFMKALGEAFADGRPAGWINQPPGSPAAIAAPKTPEKTSIHSEMGKTLAEVFDSIQGDSLIKSRAFRDAMTALEPYTQQVAPKTPDQE